MKIKIQKVEEEVIYHKKTKEFVFEVNGKKVRVLSWQEDGRDIDMPESDYEINQEDKEKLTEEEIEVFEDNLSDLFDVDTHYIFEEEIDLQ